MPDPQKQEMLAEAYRRGILPDDKRAAYEEAMRRGLVPNLMDNSMERQAADVGGMLVRGNPGFKPRSEAALQREQKWTDRMNNYDRRAAAAVDGVTSQLPFYNEYTGAVNAAASAAYNAPGAIKSGDVGALGSNIAQAYDDQVKHQRAAVNFAESEYPNQTAASKGISLGFQGVGLAKQFPALIPAQTGNVAKDVTVAGAAGAAESGLWSMLFGLGDNEGGSLDERFQRAADYGKWGAAGGALLGMGLRGAPAAYQGFKNRQQNSASGQVLEMARESGTEVGRRSGDALIGLLSRAGYARKDITRGIAEIRNGLQVGVDAVERPSIFAVELQKRFPAARQQIEDAFQQLATAPPSQGNTSQTLLGAIDDQYASQGGYLDDVFKDRLGVTTVADEQAALATERSNIGRRRDQVIKYAPSDARVKGETHEVTQILLSDMRTDPRTETLLWDAARTLGFKGNKSQSVSAAMDEAPYELLQKFGEVARTSNDDVVKSYRGMSEQLFDDVARQGPRTEFGGFARQVPEGEVGPYKTEQRRFAENYSQEDAIIEARRRVRSTKDPVDAAETIDWYNTLPEGEQRLFQTVLRQDMEKMLRGGNIDDAGAYLTNLRKRGLHDLLVKVLGRDGEDISRAIQTVADEQPALSQIDPRQGLQNRVVRGGAAQRARNHYTNNPIARFGDKIPAGGGFMIDAGLMASGQLPYLTMGRQATKLFRPGTKTREGLANVFAMRPQGRAQRALAPDPVPPTPQGPQPKTVISDANQNALAGPAPEPAPSPQGPAPTGKITPEPENLVKPQEQSLPPAMQQQIARRRAALLDPEERALPPEKQTEIIARRENWGQSNAAARNVESDYVYYGEPDYPYAGPVKKFAAGAVVTSPIWGGAGLLAYVNLRKSDGSSTPALETAAKAVERVSQNHAPPPQIKPDLSQVLQTVKTRQLEAEGVLISEDGTQYFDRNVGGWQPIENLERN